MNKRGNRYFSSHPDAGTVLKMRPLHTLQWGLNKFIGSRFDHTLDLTGKYFDGRILIDMLDRRSALT
jgi:hypothetical protein